MQCKRLVLSAALNHSGTPQQKNTQHHCAIGPTIMTDIHSGLCFHFVNILFFSAQKIIIHIPIDVSCASLVCLSFFSQELLGGSGGCYLIITG